MGMAMKAMKKAMKAAAMKTAMRRRASERRLCVTWWLCCGRPWELAGTRRQSTHSLRPFETGAFALRPWLCRGSELECAALLHGVCISFAPLGHTGLVGVWRSVNGLADCGPPA